MTAEVEATPERARRASAKRMFVEVRSGVGSADDEEGWRARREETRGLSCYGPGRR